MQAIHRVREHLIGERTATINQIRAYLLEYGIVIPVGRHHLMKRLPEILEDAENGVSGVMRELLHQLLMRLWRIQEEVDELTTRIETVAASDQRCRRLCTIPGIGPIVPAVGNAAQFRRSRDMAAWIGLVPRQYSTGGRTRLLGISKRGNRYLRRLLIHGARAVIHKVDRRPHRFGNWLTQLEQRAHRNVVAVSVANKIARIAWAVQRRSEPYRAAPAQRYRQGGLPTRVLQGRRSEMAKRSNGTCSELGHKIGHRRP